MSPARAAPSSTPRTAAPKLKVPKRVKIAMQSFLPSCREFLMAVNWKLALLGLVVTAILGAIVLRKFGVTFGRGILGFQNPGGAAENTFTMYYADWCPHCQAAKPEFKALVDKGYVGEGSKRCAIKMVGLEENPEGVKKAPKPINGFPSFLLQTAGGQVYEYSGSRDTDGYLKFINEKLGGGI